MNIYQHAMQLAEQGFYVFRLKSNAKTPAFYGWQKEATRNPDIIKDYFDNNVGYNIGIFTEIFGNPEDNTALVTIDVDTKEDKQGNATMDALDAMGCDFPPTLTVVTASGGRHLIYAHDIPLASGANKLGPHVDLKSAGAYIVAAGSTIDGIPYRITQNLAPAAVPGWLPIRCRPPLPRTHQQANVGDDGEQAVSRARSLAASVEISAGGRNDAAFKLACSIRDIGLSEPMTEDILQKWNTTNVTPPLSVEEVGLVTASAYKHAKLPQGNKSPQSEFTAVPYDPKIDAPTNSGIYYLTPDIITSMLDTNPLIEDYLDQDTLSLLFGPSNAGKTFGAMDMAYHIAMGIPWNGHFTTQGTVVYLSAEGGRSAANRVQALKEHYKNDNFPLALIPCPVNLFDSPKQFHAFTHLIEDAQTKLGPVRLIVIDTLNRTMAGGDENKSPDMSVFIDKMTFLKERFKAHVMVIHHPGKDAAKGARGHSSLRAAVDTELEMRDNLITTTKQRDMAFAKPLGYALKEVVLGQNPRGKDVTACVMSYHDAAAEGAFKMEPRDALLLQAIQNQKSGHNFGGFTNIISTDRWKELCKDCKIELVPGAKSWPKSINSFNQAFLRSRDRLVGFGYVEEVEENQWGFVVA